MLHIAYALACVLNFSSLGEIYDLQAEKYCVSLYDDFGATGRYLRYG